MEGEAEELGTDKGNYGQVMFSSVLSFVFPLLFLWCVLHVFLVYAWVECEGEPAMYRHCADCGQNIRRLIFCSICRNTVARYGDKHSLVSVYHGSPDILYQSCQ